MTPRLASSRLTQDGFARDIHRVDFDRWKGLAVQWRGFVMQQGVAVEAMHERIAREGLRNTFDPQGAFDAYQGQSPL